MSKFTDSQTVYADTPEILKLQKEEAATAAETAQPKRRGGRPKKVSVTELLRKDRLSTREFAILALTATLLSGFDEEDAKRPEGMPKAITAEEFDACRGRADLKKGEEYIIGGYAAMLEFFKVEEQQVAAILQNCQVYISALSGIFRTAYVAEFALWTLARHQINDMAARDKFNTYSLFETPEQNREMLERVVGLVLRSQERIVSTYTALVGWNTLLALMKSKYALDAAELFKINLKTMDNLINSVNMARDELLDVVRKSATPNDLYSKTAILERFTKPIDYTSIKIPADTVKKGRALMDDKFEPFVDERKRYELMQLFHIHG